MISSIHSSKQGRAWRWTGRAGDALFGAVLIVILIHSLALLVTGRHFENQVAALKAEGQPISCSEAALPLVPDAENGAAVYAVIWDRIAPAFAKNDQPLEDLLDPAKRHSDALVWKRARTALAGYQDIPGLVEQAEARPTCRFPVNWADAYSALLPHLPHLRVIGRVLLSQALIDARDGHSEKAFHLITLEARMESAIRDEPCLISQLIRMSLLNQACSAAQEVARPGNAAEPEAVELLDTLAKVDVGAGLVRAMEFERAAGLSIYALVRTHPEVASKLLSSGDETGDKKFLASWTASYPWRPLLYADESAFLQCVDRQIGELPLPWRSRNDTRGNSDTGIPHFAIVAQLLAPSSSTISRRRDMTLARISGIRIYLALLACKARTGSYPSSLAALTQALGGKVPDDPFSGKGFIYQRQNDGFILYSVGPALSVDRGSESTGASSPMGMETGARQGLVWRQGETP